MAGTATFTAVLNENIQPDSNAREETLWGTITVDAGVGKTDYATDGLTLSFLGVVPFKSAPVEVKVWSEDVADGYIFRYLPAASPAIDTGKTAVFQGTATAVPFAQIAAAALPAAITNDVKLRWRGVWQKGQ